MKSTTKWKPHYDLTTVKSLVRAGEFRLTATAAETAKEELGVMDRKSAADIILTLTGRDFYKSITSNFDHQEWQDVYLPMIGTKKGYIKFVVRDDVLLLSFKEK